MVAKFWYVCRLHQGDRLDYFMQFVAFMSDYLGQKIVVFFMRFLMFVYKKIPKWLPTKDYDVTQINEFAQIIHILQRLKHLIAY